MSDQKVKIHIEYCGAWGYAPRAKALRDTIIKELGNGAVEVTMAVGRRSSFEISANGQTVFSKLEAGGFPDQKAITEVLTRVKNGESVEKVTQTAPSGCSIL